MIECSYKNFNSESLSSLESSLILVVKRGFTKIDFFPVWGWVRITGWQTGGFSSIASLSLSRPPGSAILSLKPYEKSCSAVLSLRKDCIAGDRFSYAPFMLDHIVSPPFGGHIFDLRIEHRGGLFRKVISVCHDSILVGFSDVLSRIVISG